jgi:hypothetical protein
LTGSLDQGVVLLRNLLWWGKAPPSVRLRKSGANEVPLELDGRATRTGRVVLQLAKPSVVRWGADYRIDHALLPPDCQQAVRQALEGWDVKAPDEDGWFSARSADHGRVEFCAKELGASRSLQGIAIVIDEVNPSASALLFRILQASELVLLPLLLASSTAAGKTLTAPWPEVRILESDAQLHQILSAGAQHWWSQPWPF